MTTTKPQLILDEMLDLAAETILFVSKKDVPKSVINQLIRSISSIGANFTEAQDASSKKDFVNKIYIAKKEANESVYWLKLVAKLTAESNELNNLQDRSHKFVMMLQKIINSNRSSNDNR